MARLVFGMSKRVFLDSEFIETPHGPRFISVGLLTCDGLELYAEVTPEELEALLLANPNEFVRQHVASQFGRWPGVHWYALPAALAGWLDSLGDGDVDVIYDYSHDYLLVEQMLLAYGAPLRTRLHPMHVGYLLEDVDGEKAAESAWAALKFDRGLARHHALADAYALRLRFEAVHPTRSAPEESRTIEMIGTVSVVVPMFKTVHIESDDGQLTVSVGEDTEGVDWRGLQPGQRLRCVVHLNPTRVLSAAPLPPTFHERGQPDDC